MDAHSRRIKQHQRSRHQSCPDSPEGDLIQQAIRCGFKATNNEAEYEALIARLNLAKDMEIKKLDIRSNSQLVVNQLLGTY